MDASSPSLQSLKLQIMEHLLATSDSQVLQKIMAFFEHDELAYDLTEEQWSLVEERIAKYERGEGKTHSWEDVKRFAQQAMRE
jgi:hypothetical protein